MTAYDQDYRAWVYAQAQSIEHGNWSEVDAFQVADELRDLGRAVERDLQEALVEEAILVLSGRSMELNGVTRRLRESPSLRSLLDEMINTAIEDAALRMGEISEDRIKAEKFIHNMLYP